MWICKQELYFLKANLTPAHNRQRVSAIIDHNSAIFYFTLNYLNHFWEVYYSLEGLFGSVGLRVTV